MIDMLRTGLALWQVGLASGRRPDSQGTATCTYTIHTPSEPRETLHLEPQIRYKPIGPD